ncbi:MAG: NAD(P)-binding domain-containing protein [Cyclobacteriaceae bacterium]|nr:NAD(P)-binding domain-containing protein [Cyclobacteriaceae bacterium]UYN87267.1 MAG: NAD(P)-binding domain-containing protein [Cyclobacteriaceae bacterium]
MRIAVLGTGMVGDTIGSRLVELGHQVMMGSRSKSNEKALAFVSKHKAGASAGTFQEAAAFGEIIFNCTKGDASIDAIKLAGENINGKIIIDVANPLDFSKGQPASLLPALSNTNSLGEEIQKTFPKAKVVKTLNTMWCGLMVNPNMIGGGDHTNFICGNDADAKAKVKSLIKEFGWKEQNILDLGDITNARGTEAVLPIWLRVWGATQNGAFNFKVVS